MDQGKLISVQAEGPAETPGVGSRALDQLPGAILSAGGTEVDVVVGASITSQALIQAARSAISQLSGAFADAQVRMKPGVYRASAYGFIAIEPLSVSVTVDDTAIRGITIEPGRESMPMVNAVNALLIPRILQYQSVGIDAITGATATSKAVLQAATAALTQALTAGGSDPASISAFQKAEPKVTKSQSIDVDVLVVGLGGAGSAAAMSAAEAAYAINPGSVRVLAVDKAGKFGGTSAFCAEPMAVNPPRYKTQFNGGRDYMDGNALYNAWVAYTEGDARNDVVKTFLDNSGDTVDWLFYDHGFIFNNPLTGFGPEDIYRCKYQYVHIANKEPGRDYGKNVDRGRIDMVDDYFHRLMADYEKLGGKYMLETEVTSLIYDADSNAVRGAKARGHDGMEYTITAKSVILASGGFAGNEQMEIQYFSKNPYYQNLGGYWTVIGMTQNKGDMIRSAIDIGAGTYNIDMVPMVHVATSNMVLHDYPVYEYENGARNTSFGWINTWSLNDVPNALVLTNEVPWINSQGERFVAEGALFSWWLAGPSYFAIWSQDRLDNVAKNGFQTTTSSSAQGNHGGVPGKLPVPEIYDIVQKAIDQGFMVKADTIGELAALIKVPAGALTKTISDYNTYAASGRDAQFGKNPERVLALGTGPFYAIKGYSAIFSTVGGLDVDSKLNVLKADGKTPIKGLYAVGNESGGVLYSNKKPYVTFGGAALGWAFTSGRLAGGFAVEYAKAD
jgi:fumarate reductase flavoprotein subunit